ncbi:unnamed protein product, partial [Ceratitis capitata]
MAAGPRAAQKVGANATTMMKANEAAQDKGGDDGDKDDYDYIVRPLSAKGRGEAAVGRHSSTERCLAHNSRQLNVRQKC